MRLRRVLREALAQTPFQYLNIPSINISFHSRYLLLTNVEYSEMVKLGSRSLWLVPKWYTDGFANKTFVQLFLHRSNMFILPDAVLCLSTYYRIARIVASFVLLDRPFHPESSRTTYILAVQMPCLHLPNQCSPCTYISLLRRY